MDSIKYWTEEVLTITGDETVRSAAKRMHAKDVSSLLIMDGKKPQGIITERDMTILLAKELDPDKTKVADVMSRNLITISIDEKLETARNFMLEHNFGHILVVAENGDLVGVASIRDISRIWKNQENVHVLKFTTRPKTDNI
jgi:CBS domain-containing protein